MWLQGLLGSETPNYQREHCEALKHQSASSLTKGSLRDVLCTRLFTLSLNPVAWKLKATEGYRLSKTISTKFTDVLSIDDMQIYAASNEKLGQVMKETRGAMSDVGLKVEREEVCNSKCQTRTAGGFGWNDNRSTQANQEFKRKRPVPPISGSSKEQETGKKYGAKERRERVLEEGFSDMVEPCIWLQQGAGNQSICAPGDDILHVDPDLPHH